VQQLSNSDEVTSQSHHFATCWCVMATTVTWPNSSRLLVVGHILKRKCLHIFTPLNSW